MTGEQFQSLTQNQREWLLNMLNSRERGFPEVTMLMLPFVDMRTIYATLARARRVEGCNCEDCRVLEGMGEIISEILK